MRKKQIITAFVAVLSAACLLSSCQGGLYGDDQKLNDRESVDKGPWTAEEITESLEVDNDSGAVSEGRIYFGESRKKALLLSADGVITWLYAKDESIFAPFDTGDLVRVGHGGVMMSYPGQTNISKIALLEDGNISSFTDEELARLMSVSDGFE